MYNLGVEKSEEPGIKLPTFAGSWEKQGDSRKTFTSASLTTLNKAFDCVDHNKLWKILKEMGIPDHLTCLLSDLYEGQEATVRTEYETTDWFRIGKEYVKAVYCHLAYLIYMQNTSCNMVDWMKHKLESRFQGEISIASDMRNIPSLWEKANKRAS